MIGGLKGRLALLMLLQYATFGAWFVSFGSFMSKGLNYDSVIGLAYGSQGLATIISVFMMGTLADRYFELQKLLACAFFLSALSLLAIATLKLSVGFFLLLVFVHFLTFIPTIPLANALCFRWLENPEMAFPRIRAVGTAGWIGSGLLVGSIPGAAQGNVPLLIAAASCGILSAYCLTLPATPPRQTQVGQGLSALLGIDAIMKQGSREFWIVVIATFLIMLPMAFYYAYCNNFLTEAGAIVQIGPLRFEPTALQSMGQVSELVFLLLLPVFLGRFGVKAVLLLGIASWALRYALFAMAATSATPAMWMLVTGVLLHGAANDFVQVAGQIYVNTCFDEGARSRAQAFLTTVLMGVGTIFGSVVANQVYAAFTVSASRHDWVMIWGTPAVAALAIMAWFLFAFRPARSFPPKP